MPLDGSRAPGQIAATTRMVAATESATAAAVSQATRGELSSSNVPSRSAEAARRWRMAPTRRMATDSKPQCRAPGTDGARLSPNRAAIDRPQAPPRRLRFHFATRRARSARRRARSVGRRQYRDRGQPWCFNLHETLCLISTVRVLVVGATRALPGHGIREDDRAAGATPGRLIPGAAEASGARHATAERADPACAIAPLGATA